MTSKTKTYLEQCLPEGQLANRAWLKARGFNRPRVDYALRAEKLAALSRGIYRRPGPPLKWEHVVYSLNEMEYSVHVGGRSALEFQGFAHYLPMGDTQRIDLYSNFKIPAWTERLSESFKFKISTKQLFKGRPEQGIQTRPFGAWDWPIPYSQPERALLELLSDVKEAADFSIVDKFFQATVNLRPDIVYKLLVNCRQIKAKRLFLWFSDRHNHEWRQALELDGIDLGSGKRMLVKGGAYDPTYQITVPGKMAEKSCPN